MALTEKLEVVQLTASNTIESLLSLNDFSHYFMKSGSFKVVAPVATRVEAADQRRWGGARQVGEVHANGAVAWEANVAGATSQEAIERVEILLAQLAANPTPLLLLWQAAGVSQPTLYQMRGSGHWEALFDVGVLEGAGLFPIQVEIPVAPLAQGLPVKVLEQSGVTLPAVLSLEDIPGDAPAKAEVSIATGTVAEESFITGAHEPAGVAIDSEHIYWANSETGYIGRAKLNGSSVEETWLHVEGKPVSVVVNSEYVYWGNAESGDIGRAKIAGSSIEKTWIAAEGGESLAVAINGSHVYWLTATHVGRATLAGGSVEPKWRETEGASKAAGIAINTGSIYWVSQARGGKYVGRMNINGEAVEPFWVTVAGSTYGGIALTSEYLYYGGSSHIGRMLITGESISGSWLSVSGHVAGLALNSEDLYWAVRSGGNIGRANVAPATANPPIWALLGWASKPSVGLAAAPFGILTSSAAEAASAEGWTLQTNAGATGGKMYQGDVVRGALAWAVDPATMAPDSFSGEIAVEVWARVLLNAPLSSVNLTLSAQPQDGIGYGAPRYTDEWGSAGRNEVLPEGDEKFRLTRLGVLHLLVNPLAPRIWKLVVEGTITGATISPWGLDCLFLAPSLQRACSPSSKPNNAAYPKFIANSTATVKTIRSDLSGLVNQPGKNGHPDHGLGGQLLQLPAGETQMLVKLSSMIPDAPEVTPLSEQLDYPAVVTVWVTPRWQLVRTS